MLGYRSRLVARDSRDLNRLGRKIFLGRDAERYVSTVILPDWEREGAAITYREAWMKNPPCLGVIVSLPSLRVVSTLRTSVWFHVRHVMPLAYCV